MSVTGDTFLDAIIYVVMHGWHLDQPFDVDDHERMLLRIRGKEPQTVLALEAMLYTWRISEYTDPLSYGRHWCYETVDDAIRGLIGYLDVPVAVEPQGWIRATDFGDGVKAHDRHYEVRVRRSHYEFGERVISVDGEEI